MDSETVKRKVDDYKVLTKFGYSKFHLACGEGFKDEVVDLLNAAKKEKLVGELVNLLDGDQRTPIFYAIDGSETGFPDVVGKFLIRCVGEKRYQPRSSRH